MLNIIIPMAGVGKRFQEAGYVLPKPLIPIKNRPMIEVVVKNLKPNKEHRFIFIIQSEHEKMYSLTSKLKEISPNCLVIQTENLTEGAACTVLLAKEYINNDMELMVANCDQWIDFDINEYLATLEKKKLDGLIMTMHASDPKWSFVSLDKDLLVKSVVEKKVISNEATVGIYNFKKGSLFVNAAQKMISKNLRVNNEFYVAPVYNELIEEGLRIGIQNIGKDFSGMYGLGTPLDLEKFLASSILKNVK